MHGANAPCRTGDPHACGGGLPKMLVSYRQELARTSGLWTKPQITYVRYAYFPDMDIGILSFSHNEEQ